MNSQYSQEYMKQPGGPWKNGLESNARLTSTIPGICRGGATTRKAVEEKT